MKYIISSFYPDAEITVKTNDPEVAILELMTRDAAGVHAHVQDGETGEVLALVNHPGQFATPEFSLMALGMIAKLEHEQAEEEGEECLDCECDPDPVATIFQALLDTCAEIGTNPGLPVPIMISDGGESSLLIPNHPILGWFFGGPATCVAGQNFHYTTAPVICQEEK